MLFVGKLAISNGPQGYGLKCKKAVHHLKKTGVLGKFHPGKSCSTIGHEFNVS